MLFALLQLLLSPRTKLVLSLLLWSFGTTIATSTDWVMYEPSSGLEAGEFEFKLLGASVCLCVCLCMFESFALFLLYYAVVCFFFFFKFEEFPQIPS